jgi:hypothetical protein
VTLSPTVVNRSTLVLTPRGHLAVQLARIRSTILGLNAADREWAGDALLVLLADCRARIPANMKGA